MLIYKKFFGQLGNTADTGIFWASPLPKGKNWVNGRPWKGITTLDLEQFLRGVRTPARPTPKEWLCIAVVWKLGPKAPEWFRKLRGKSKKDVDDETKATTTKEKEGIAEPCRRIQIGCVTAKKKKEYQRKSWYTSTCSEYLEKECVGTLRSRSAKRGSS